MKRTLLVAFLAACIAAAADRAVLWNSPGPVATLDLAAGPGGRESFPQPPFAFEKEELTGTNPKVLVRDARGVNWSVKFGPEAKPESFAMRFVWAAGYMAEPTYFLREGTITGVGKLGRVAPFIDSQTGHFADARFQIRDDARYRLVRGSRWSLDEPSLKGTKELSGLKLVVMLLANWDVKPENLALIETGGRRYYSIIDWGASMGRAGDFTGRSKWDCSGYARQSDYFVDGVGDGYVSFNFSGKERDVVSGWIRVEDVKWFMGRMGQLTDAQIRAGLEASGATSDEAACFTQAMRKRLTQLNAITASTEQSTETVIRSRTVTTK